MAILALRYRRKKIFYTVTVVASLLLITLTAYGYMGSKFGWFTDVEVIPLESDLPAEEKQSENSILEELNE
ncbi:hypothetical protein [Marinilactibacillus piezotolerans]|uniref:hypothetical protein n=1 Tax=Marinilactibacillus piezotolerans TaxID=258723 RepID=UPI00117E162A|nr:hypothetical protein [Marinilactibacillus piezotolerans]